jgi:periplasmic protein TonB
MSELLAKGFKPISRDHEPRDSRGRLSKGPIIYNRSSLAVDLEIGSAVQLQPLPQLVGRPNAGAAAIPATMFRGLDPSLFKKDRKAKVISFVLHALVIAVVLYIGFNSQRALKAASTVVTRLDFTLTAPPPVLPVAKALGGGGGGGAHKVIVPNRGRPPVVAKVNITPPELPPMIKQPILTAEPSAQVKMPTTSNMPNLGMNQSPQIALASQGSGSHSGFGMGMSGGLGVGTGAGAGPGSGGGYGGGIMSVGGGVTAPQVIHSVEPEFTDQARRANYQGTVSIELIVDTQGYPQDLRITRHLGMGLDQKALEAVRQYKFRPSMYQGHPVAVQMVIDVDFRLH